MATNRRNRGKPTVEPSAPEATAEQVRIENPKAFSSEPGVRNVITPAPMTKAARREAQQAMARKQADIDARRVIGNTEVPVLKPGEFTPLNVLNQRARAIDRAMRDAAREAANAAGKAAFDVLTGKHGGSKLESSVTSRHRNIAKMQQKAAEDAQKAL